MSRPYRKVQAVFARETNKSHENEKQPEDLVVSIHASTSTQRYPTTSKYSMNVGHFPPPKRRGLIIHGLLILILAAIATFG
ncbi:MAG: hypothetical protein AB1649_19340, partial [Chloroflexota bacterium]